MPPLALARHCGWWLYLRSLWHLAVLRFHALWATPTTSAEISFGLIAIGWGLVLQISPVFAVGNLYDYLAEMAPQPVWAGIMLLLGVAQLAIAWLLDMRCCRLVRSAVWLASMVVWSYIGWVSILAVPMTTAAAAYGTLAVGSLWAFLRAGEGQ